MTAHYQTLDDGELLTRYGRDRCDASFRELHARYDRRIVGFLWSCFRLRSPDSDDLAQQTWLCAVTKYAQYDPARPFEKWLFAIAANHAKDHLRWRDKMRCRFDCRPALDSLSQQVESEESQAVLEAIGHLTSAQSAAIRCVYYADQTQAEAADTLGIAVPTLEKRLQRARESLRESLTALGFAERSELKALLA